MRIDFFPLVEERRSVPMGEVRYPAAVSLEEHVGR